MPSNTTGSSTPSTAVGAPGGPRPTGPYDPATNPDAPWGDPRTEGSIVSQIRSRNGQEAQYLLDQARTAYAAGDQAGANAYLERIRPLLSNDWTLDEDTGQIRETTHWERQKGTYITAAIMFGTLGLGAFLAPAGQAAGGASSGTALGTGIGLGETGAVAGIPGGAATLGSAGAFAGGVGAEIAGPGLYGPGSAGFDALSQTQLNPGPATSSNTAGPLGAEPPTTTGLPNGSTGVPGAQPAPSVGADLINGGSAVAGQTAGVAPAAAGPGIVSSQGIAGISYPSLIGAGLSYLQSRQSANAAQQASQAQIDAANRALDEQRRQYDLSRSDYLGNQAYTRQQISGLAPFQAIGVGSLSNLARLTGQSVPAGVANYQPPASQPPPAQAPVLQPNTLSGGQPNPSGTTSNVTSLADFVRTTSDARRSQLGLPPSGGAGGGMVTIQAPTGERQAVPASQAQFYTARGGRVVS